MIVYFLFMPVLVGIFNKVKSSPTITYSVLEINDNNANTQRMIVTRVNNMLNRSPANHIEVVATGSGIHLLAQDSKHNPAIQSLMGRGVIFTVCENSLKKLSATLSASLPLLPGVKLTPDGHRYAEQLKDNGYTDELA